MKLTSAIRGAGVLACEFKHRPGASQKRNGVHRTMVHLAKAIQQVGRWMLNVESWTLNVGPRTSPQAEAFRPPPSALVPLPLLLLLAFSAQAADTNLVSHGEAWLYRKGTNAPQSNWQSLSDAALDASWSIGNGGFGYANNIPETNNCQTIVSDMLNGYTTLYIRRTFQVTNAIDPNLRLKLIMDWDDGFVAYLDGVEVQRQVAPGSVGVEPAFNDVATANREASTGNSTPLPVETFDLGPVGSRLDPGEHVLAIIGLNRETNSSDFILVADLAYGPITCPANTICVDTTWPLSGSPYVITSTLTVSAGATLTIEPGVTVQFTNGVGMNVPGRLIAEGDPTNRITFTRATGATNWTRLTFSGSQQSRLTFCDIAWGIRSTSEGTITGNNTALYLESIVWTNITGQLLDLNNSSVVLLNSVLPSVSSAELYHHGGLPTNGYAFIKGNTFGSSGGGLNDIIDFTGGQRPGAILQLYDNVFLGGTDDALDLDGTDAHIEGNIFMGFHAVGGPGNADTASAISGGRSGSLTSRITITRNLIFDCDRAILCKENNFYVVQNNTIVNMAVAAVNFNEPLRSGVTPGSGVIFDGNIVWNTPANFENVTTNSIAANYNIFSASDFTNRGVGNLTGNPLLTGTNSVTAQNIRDRFALLPGSPGIGTGPNGLDRGGLVSAGASISGEPIGITTNNSATLTIAGPGIAGYLWRTNDGPWSSSVPLTNSFIYSTNLFVGAAPITLANLADGAYTVHVLGFDSAGLFQDTNAPSVSQTWIVELDSDSDGLPDWWEQANGTNPDAADADDDLDTDGASNRDEYRAGTAANDPASVLRLTAGVLPNRDLLLSFDAISNRSYTVESRLSLALGNWEPWAEIASAPTNRPIALTNSASPDAEFFRIKLQPQP